MSESPSKKVGSVQKGRTSPEQLHVLVSSRVDLLRDVLTMLAEAQDPALRAKLLGLMDIVTHVDDQDANDGA